MKTTFSVLRFIIRVIALLVFIGGIIITLLGGYELIMSLTHLGDDKEKMVALTAVALLQSMDMFLIAIVFFVFSLGMLVLFNRPDEALPLKLPEWIKIKNFMELKLILWESILTTLVVAYFSGIVRAKMQGHDITIYSLVVPGAILLIAISLFFLKKGEGH
jgi:uncharacterized membrane protein YqhA